MKKLKDLNIKDKTVIIRVDFNVPLSKDLKIIDDTRIKESLETINYCLKQNCKIILLSHLGKVKTEKDMQTNSLKPVSKRLSELLNKEIIFIPKTRGILVEQAIKKMKNQDIILLENTRFEDLNGNLESENNSELAKYWASLADIFINDAFATSHRIHASNVGISKYIKESCIGFLFQKEIDNLLPIITNPNRPFTIILGGAKISDKIKFLNNLINKTDYILIGGAMAYTFLKAKDKEIGKSLIDEDGINLAKDILNKYPNIILPIDHVVAKNLESNKYEIKENLSWDDIGVDIGPKTVELFKKYLQKSNTVFWNGPLGYYENKNYLKGTKNICEIISKLNIVSIVGGGDTTSTIVNLGYKNKFSHISTGGGASLKLLEGEKLLGGNL